MSERDKILTACGWLADVELPLIADHIAELEAQVNRECKWQKQAIGAYAEYDSWATSCGEDYAIMEEWDETPPPYCGHCGGKVVDVTKKIAR